MINAIILTMTLMQGECLKFSDRQIASFSPDTPVGMKIRRGGYKVVYRGENWATLRIIDFKTGSLGESTGDIRFNINEVPVVDFLQRTPCKFKGK